QLLCCRCVASVSLHPTRSSRKNTVSSTLQEEDLVETLDDMGYEAHVQELDAGRTFRVVVARFRVQGMTCSTCVSAVEHALAGVRGVRKAAVALATAEAEVEY